MKLLFVHQYLGEFGGAEASISVLAGELRRRGHTLTLLHSTRTGRNENHWARHFSRCFCLSPDRHDNGVTGLLESLDPDVIFLHNSSDLNMIESLISWRAPVVRMVHDHALYCMRTTKYHFLTRQICHRPASLYCVFPCLGFLARNRTNRLPVKWVSYAEKLRELRLSRQCAGFLVYSEYQKQELILNGFNPGRIHLCVPLAPESEDQQSSSLDNQNLVLFAGQIIRGKGVDVLLDALARVKTRFRCVILGEGHHRPYCERKCARLGLSNRVRFAGHVPPADLKAYYLQASLMVVSSLWPEPFGLTGPEGMRYGLPVVAFDAGGIREWLRDGETGFLVPWKNTALFARRIEQLLEDKPLARLMGRTGRTWVKRYDCLRQVDTLEGFFQQVVHQTPAEPLTIPANPICL
jgi:glycosyltransferase involved in cell wall biosynthesis